jgi:hypothetical protein
MPNAHSTRTRVLVAYSMGSTFVQATFDYLMALKRLAEIEVHYLHVTHNQTIDVDLRNYDIIFNSYCARLCIDGYVNYEYDRKLQEFGGVKILAVQDEYDQTDLLKAAIIRLGFDIVLTCVPQDALEYVYPAEDFPGTRFLTVFTGYVVEDFESGKPPIVPLAQRPIPIGYRGRDIGGRYGRLGFDKFEIGRRIRAICEERGIACDIAVDEESRIYGKDWLRFVGNCRAMLGTESGSNVFDFDGSIAAKFREMTQANGGIPPSYAEFYPVVADRDAQIDMGQVSPRVFECAIMRTPMVLFRGRYSDVIEPDVHYIPLEKDFSNIDDVLARIEDIPALEEMAERAYRHLVGSGAFGYSAFVRRVLDAALPLLAQRRRIEEERPVLEPATGHGLSIAADWEPVELPSVLPGTAEDFRMRLDLREVAQRRDATVHLLDEVERLRSIYAGEAERLRDAYDDRYRVHTELADPRQEWMPKIDPAILDFTSVMPNVTAQRDRLLPELDRLVEKGIRSLAAEEIDQFRATVAAAQALTMDARNSAQDSLTKINRIHPERIILIQAAIAELNARVEQDVAVIAAAVREQAAARRGVFGILSGLKRCLQKLQTLY